MSLFSLKPDPVVGIDISSTAVKLLELSKSGNTYCVEGYALEPLPENTVVDKNISEDKLEEVGQVIGRAIQNAKPKTEYAAVAVAGPAVINKVITMDSGLTDEEIMSALEVDGESYIGMPIDEVKLDFEIIGPNEKEPEQRTDILLVAARTELVESRVAALESASMKVRVVDVEKYALENALLLVIENNPEIDINETIALVEVGATTTSLNVLGDGKIVYNREEMFGGKSLADSVQGNYGLSHEEASLAIRSGDVAEDYDSMILDPFKEEVAQQISRMTQYYYSMEVSSKYGQLSHILIAGGCASIPGLEEQVSNKTGGHVSIINPFHNMTIAPRISKKELMNDAPALMIACGLALRTFDEY